MPRLATDRIAKTRPETRGKPLVTVREERGRLLIAAVNRAAEEIGLVPGLTPADARARQPGLVILPADPVGDAGALRDIAAWCGRYTPWTAVEAGGQGDAGLGGLAGGLWLDIAGCGHLFGGEAALLSDLVGRLSAVGFSVRAAVADGPGAAWAWCRFGPDSAGPDQTGTVPAGEAGAYLAPLPMAALRLPPALLETLDRLGLRRVGDLCDLPRAALTARFGTLPARRLDQALGRVPEPIAPLRPAASHAVRFAFPEPVARPEAVARGLELLLDRLCARLERERRGVRRLEFTLYRSDGTTARAAIGTSRPSRAPAHLARLFAPRLESLDPDPGVEVLVLAAPTTDPLAAAQTGLQPEQSAVPDDGLGTLIDRLANRLGGGNVWQSAARESHLPERAVLALPTVGAAGGGPSLAGGESGPAASRRPGETAPAAWPGSPRPLRLLPCPEQVEATAPAPGEPAGNGAERPPLQFRWRRRLHRIARTEGPERIAPEWWRPGEADAPTRDYYRIEDTEGRRYWLYRASQDWFLHGVFA